MSAPTSAASQPTSFKTNVNRAKTKRWVEAKSYSYDGDDWGDIDDYDEYSGYQDPPPPQRPTGLRQHGQSASKLPEEHFGQEIYQSPVSQDDPRSSSRGATGLQQQLGSRSVTSPSPQHQANVQRPGTFERGDERRAFSAGMSTQGTSSTSKQMHPPISQGHNLQGPTFQTVSTHPDRPLQPQLGPTRPPVQIPNQRSVEDHLRFGGQQQSMGTNVHDVQPQDQTRVPSGGSRTQSLNSDYPLDFHTHRDFSPSAMPPPLQTPNSPSPSNDPWSRPPRKTSLSQQTQPTLPVDPRAPTIPGRIDDRVDALQRERAGSASSSTKSLPFVRPADIYKRIEEERERERRSHESSRPSLDTILGRPNERPSLDTKRESDSASRLKPKLGRVTECENGYGFEGDNVSDQQNGSERPQTTSKRFELKKASPPVTSQGSSLSPGMVLPDPTHVSGFGEGFGESFMGSDDNFGQYSRSSTLSPTEDKVGTKTKDRVEVAGERDLQHQPSKGFKSVVHQAFDTAQDQVPPTPSSTADSSIVRSASGGTSAVSPIMSRGPSAIDRDRNDGLPSIDDVATPTQDEGDEKLRTRHGSAGSMGTLTHASQSQAVQEELIEMPPPGFVPGHRRNMSTPSADNSPSRTPEIASMRHLKQPQEVDLAETTPTPTDSIPSSSNSIRDSDPPSDQKHTYIDSPASPSQPFIGQRTDSASSGRVRNLANKFESHSRPGSDHSNSTPRASMLGSGSPISVDSAPARPINERMESFRPHLPGGWESSASIGATSAPSQPTYYQNRELHPQASNSTDRTKELSPSKFEQTSRLAQIKDTSTDAFSAAAEAGNAIAGALVSAVGYEKDGASKDHTSATRDRAASTITVVHPEASRPQMPQLGDDDSVASTPPPKDIPRALETEEPRSDYFASSQAEEKDIASTSSGLAPAVAKQPVSLPALSTDVQPRQYESDRLRREIARELSPGMPSEPSTAETDSPYQAASKYTINEPVSGRSRESGALPSEYDSYWNDKSDDSSSSFGGEPEQVVDAITAQRQQGAAVVGKSTDPAHTQPPTSTEPITSQQPIPRALQHRFSWEQPLADLCPPSQTGQESLPAAHQNVQPSPTSDFLKNQVYPEGHTAIPQAEAVHQPEPLPEQYTRQVPNPTPEGLPTIEPDVAPEKNATQKRPSITTDQVPDLPRYPVGLEVVTPLPEKQSTQSGERQDAGSVPTPKQQSAAMPQETPPGSSTHVTTPVTEDSQLPPPPTSAPPKLPSFREIMALKTPTERIRAFNDTQQQFSNMNTGLAHWLAATTSRLPEHGDILINQGRTCALGPGHKSSPSRSKLGGLISTGGQSGQPYYQQYLDASPQAAGPVSTAPGGDVGISPSQAFSSSSGKISGQQVQAKSKELLHSAGIIGGKANVAAKGLFSKGKSKLRDASGSKKVYAADSERDAPSVQSFTQSQLGDDERSEDSTVNSSNRLPRSSYIYLRRSQPQVAHVDTTKAAPKDSQERHVGESHAGTPEQKQSPRSTKSSNKTPTQASFDRAAGPDLPSAPKAPDTTHDVRSGNNIPATIKPSEKSRGSRDSPLPSPKSGYFTQPSARTDNGISVKAALSRVDRAGSKRASEQSVIGLHPSTGEVFYGLLDSYKERRDQYTQSTRTSKPQQEPHPRLPRGSDSARQSSLEHAINTSHAQNSLSVPELSSPNDESKDRQRQSQELSMERPSTDSGPSRIDPNGPPSPVSPQYPIQMTPQPRGRPIVPVHHGIDHDFGPESELERARRRSPSFSRPLDLSEQRRRSSGPSLQDHAALRLRTPSAEGLAMPAHLYPDNIKCEQVLVPRQQVPEYAMEGIGPPDLPPVVTKARSRRGSRSSAFFKSLAKSITDSDSPTLATPPGDHLDSSPGTSTTMKSKRYSVFELRKSQTDITSDKMRSREEVAPTSAPRSTSSTFTQLPPPAAPPKPVVDDGGDEFPHRPDQRTSTGLSQRLQRKSTSRNEVEKGSKKKRFSVMGSLFGGSGRKRQNSVEQSRKHSQQASPHSQEVNDPYYLPATPLQRSLEYPSVDPKSIQPPDHGYYAPKRGSSLRYGTAPPNPTPQSTPTAASRSPQNSTPAYVQDVCLRQASSPQTSIASHKNLRPSTDSFPRVSGPVLDEHVSRSEKKPKGSPWTLFSPNKDKGLPSSIAPVRGVSPAAQYNSFPSPQTQSNYSTQQAPTAGSSRPESPPPPLPPPKDDWHHAQPRHSSLAASNPPAGISTMPSQPLANSAPSQQQRQLLPPLQTNVPSPHLGPIRSGMSSGNPKSSSIAGVSKANMTPEEKRKSRQQEIETDHFSPTSAGAVSPAKNNALNGVKDREGDETIVMSAASFPGQEWQPDYDHAWMG
ncbi:MAG: hypothetical protein Q9217_003828 [Psora testacea]